MKTILKQYSDVVRQAGKALVKNGADLAAGHIDGALDKLETAKQQYREWVELDKAISDTWTPSLRRSRTSSPPTPTPCATARSFIPRATTTSSMPCVAPC
jgi:hypothetical protein